VQHDDWGVRADRWSGIRSEMVRRPRCPRPRPAPRRIARRAGRRADPQLLVHGLGGSSTNWLEVMARSARTAPSSRPTCPASGGPSRRTQSASRTGVNARFLGALARALGLDRVVVHGNSMGGLLGVLTAELEPDRVERLVLVDPALPARLRSMRRISGRTLARFAPFAVPPLGRAVLRLAWEPGTPESLYHETADFIHGDPANLSPEMEELGIANLAWGREQPWRLPGSSPPRRRWCGRDGRARAAHDAVDRGSTRRPCCCGATSTGSSAATWSTTSSIAGPTGTCTCSRRSATCRSWRRRGTTSTWSAAGSPPVTTRPGSPRSPRRGGPADVRQRPASMRSSQDVSRIVDAVGVLELGDVAAVVPQLDLGGRQAGADAVGVAVVHEPVVAAEDPVARHATRGEPVPVAVAPVALLEPEVAGAGRERQPVAGFAQGQQDVGRGGTVVGVRDPSGRGTARGCPPRPSAAQPQRCCRQVLGRVTRSSGPSRWYSSNATAAPSPTTLRTDPGWRRPSSVAMRPPIELPTTCATRCRCGSGSRGPRRPSTPSCSGDRRGPACSTSRSPAGRARGPRSGRRRGRRASAGTTPCWRPARAAAGPACPSRPRWTRSRRPGPWCAWSAGAASHPAPDGTGSRTGRRG
jgi:pimeloyl-ACP methyl ester carboxylesterase